MHKNLQNRPKLLIVSDTAMKRTNKNKVEAFEPVVREIENFHYLFEKITWIGYDYSDDPSRKNMRSAKGTEIEYIILSRTGGRTFLKKLEIIYKLIPYFLIVKKQIKENDVIHTRAPSMPAFLAIFISFFDRKRNYWHKYAGSWIDTNAPVFYKLQRYLLEKAKHTHVTINGKWPNQKKHLLTFENPCLSEKEYMEAKKSVIEKNFNSKLNFCFIGNLNDDKGVSRIIQAFKQIRTDKIGKIHFIGDGANRQQYEMMAKELPVIFHGFLLRSKMAEILKQVHFLLLPSKSEGFPKVVAEAASYGIIPIVSAVSSLPQYIDDGRNGFLIECVTTESLIKTLLNILILDSAELQDISENSLLLPKKFTYEYYNKRIENDILGYQDV